MQPYLYYYLFMFIVAILSLTFKSERNNRILFYITALVVWLFISLRGKYVGTDTIAYVDFFHDSDFHYRGEPTDVMFEFIARILHFFGSSTEYFIFVISTIYFYGIYFIVDKLSSNKALSFVLFSILGTTFINLFLYMFLIRQCTSLTFFFIAAYLYFKDDKKYLIYSLLLFITAVLIHGSTLFTLPFLVLIKHFTIRSKRMWIALVILTYIIGVNSFFSFKDLISYIFSLVQFLPLKDYSSYAQISFGLIEDKGWFNMNLIPFTLLGVYLIIKSTYTFLNTWYNKFFLFSVLLNNLLSDNQMWNRLILFFSIFSIISIVNSMESTKKSTQFIFYSIIFVYYAYKLGNQLIAQALPMQDVQGIVPYYTWLINF